MKLLALAVCAAGVAFAFQNWPLRAANFKIRFAPDAVLQTEVAIPFRIQVINPDERPVTEAKVTLEIHRPDHSMVTVFRAPAIDPGVYMAKPIFPSPGTWEVYVQVQWEDQHGARTIEYNVPRTATP